MFKNKKIKKEDESISICSKIDLDYLDYKI